MGQGERMQHFYPELGTSKIEPSGEHEHGNQTALLVGQHIARYWFADGVRSVHYLTQRADVDAARIGTFGCSGGAPPPRISRPWIRASRPPRSRRSSRRSRR